MAIEVFRPPASAHRKNDSWPDKMLRYVHWNSKTHTLKLDTNYRWRTFLRILSQAEVIIQCNSVLGRFGFNAFFS